MNWKGEEQIELNFVTKNSSPTKNRKLGIIKIIIE